MTPSFRYVDGALVAFDVEPHHRVLISHPEPTTLRFNMPEMPRRLGLCGLDLAREERRSGVPRWFKPNASRRGRSTAWARMSAADHRRMQDEFYPVVKHETLDRHEFADGRGRRAYLYLPEGQPPTAVHGRDIERATAERRKAT